MRKSAHSAWCQYKTRATRGVNEMFAALSQAAKRSTLMAVHSLVLTQSLSIPFRSASIEELGSDELGFEASNQRLDWCR